MTKDFLLSLGLSEDSIQRVLDAFQDALQRQSAQHQSQLDAIHLHNALDTTLRQNGAHDPKAVIPFLDLNSISFQDGLFSGLDAQIQRLRQDKSFLFIQPQTSPANAMSLTALAHGSSPSPDPASMSDAQYYAAFAAKSSNLR